MLNKVTLAGHLGRDPETKTVGANDSVVCNASLATTERWTDKQGDKQEETTWHDLEAWGRTAEIMGKYLKKGSAILVEGSLRRQTWTDKDSGDKRSRVVVKVLSFHFLDSKTDQSTNTSTTDADIPF